VRGDLPATYEPSSSTHDTRRSPDLLLGFSTMHGGPDDYDEVPVAVRAVAAHTGEHIAALVAQDRRDDPAEPLTRADVTVALHIAGALASTPVLPVELPPMSS
jgi:hypothetical protein